MSKNAVCSGNKITDPALHSAIGPQGSHLKITELGNFKVDQSLRGALTM